MNIAIMVSAHKNKNQLLRLINHLKTDFDVHVYQNTILMRSKLSDNCIDDSLRYTVWNGGVLNMLLLTCYTLFACKVGFKIDSEIIDKLYEDITSG